MTTKVPLVAIIDGGFGVSIRSESREDASLYVYFASTVRWIVLLM